MQKICVNMRASKPRFLFLQSVNNVPMMYVCLFGCLFWKFFFFSFLAFEEWKRCWFWSCEGWRWWWGVVVVVFKFFFLVVFLRCCWSSFVFECARVTVDSVFWLVKLSCVLKGSFGSKSRVFEGSCHVILYNLLKCLNGASRKFDDVSIFLSQALSFNSFFKLFL